MSEYSDRVRGSLVVSNLRQSETKLRGLGSRGWKYQNKIDLIDRLKVVTGHTLGRLTVPDCSLITETTLDELGPPSQELLNAIEQIQSLPWDDESDNTHINRVADDLLRTAINLPALPFTTTPAAVEKAAEQFNREAESATNAVSEKVREVQSQLSENLNEVQSRLTAILAKLEEVSEQSRDHLAQTQQTMESQITQIQNEANSLQMQVRSATTRLEREVSNAEARFERFHSQHSQEFDLAQETRDREYHESLDSTIADIKDLRDQAQGMLEEVAGANTAEHYATQQDKQYKAADRWRRVGVIALGLLVLAAVGLFVDLRTADGDMSVVVLVGRFGVPASLVLLATYALRQSGHHRQREEDVSRVANELMLLWPFMNRLPDEDRKALLLQITPLYFKGGLSPHDSGDKIGWADRAVDIAARRNRS